MCAHACMSWLVTAFLPYGALSSGSSTDTPDEPATATVRGSFTLTVDSNDNVNQDTVKQKVKQALEELLGVAVEVTVTVSTATGTRRRLLAVQRFDVTYTAANVLKTTADSVSNASIRFTVVEKVKEALPPGATVEISEVQVNVEEKPHSGSARTHAGPPVGAMIATAALTVMSGALVLLAGA